MYKIVFAILFISSSFWVGAQSEIRQDLELWLAAKVEYGVFKKTNASLALASRYENNAQFSKTKFAQIGIQFNQLKDISFSLNYRYAVDGKDNEVEQRIMMIGAYKYRLKPFDVSYRLRADNFFGNDDFFDRVRNKFQIAYRKKKRRYRPFISYEIFTTHKNKGWIMDQYRAKAGLKYKLSKSQNISFYYGIQSEFNTTFPERDFILGSSYSYSFD